MSDLACEHGLTTLPPVCPLCADAILLSRDLWKRRWEDEARESNRLRASLVQATADSAHDHNRWATERLNREARLAEAEAAAKTWENEAERRSRRYEKCAVALAEAERRKLQLIATLQSIASNSCCDNCREAALVAQSAIDAAIDAAMGESRE